MSPSKDTKIQDILPVSELKEWLLGRVADDNDIVIDDLQEDFNEQFEIEDEKKGIKVKGVQLQYICLFIKGWPFESNVRILVTIPTYEPGGG